MSLDELEKALLVAVNEMDDCARMNIGVDAIGPRTLLEAKVPELIDRCRRAEARVAELEVQSGEVICYRYRPTPKYENLQVLFTPKLVNYLGYEPAEPLYLRAQQAVQSEALRDVAAERQRQISIEGWTPEHDDQHEAGSMARAAATYAAFAFPSDEESRQFYACLWPWERAWWKPANPRRDLVKAGALILAEIERIDRAAAPSPEGEKE